MRIGLCQIDTRVGDLAGNAARILAAARAAADAGAELCVLPELAVTGVPPRDLLEDDAFVEAALATTHRLARDLADGPPVLVGTIARTTARTTTPLPGAPRRRPLGLPGPPRLHNALALLHRGTLAAVHGKRLLPGYDVFHEPRWFAPAPPAPPFPCPPFPCPPFPGMADPSSVLAAMPIGPLVCEDLWSEGYPEDPAADLRRQGARLLVCASASPFRHGVLAARLHHARRAQRPLPTAAPPLPHAPPAALVYVNAVGAQDELIFDGRSFALDPEGRPLLVLPAFEEAVEVVDLAVPTPTTFPPPTAPEVDLRAALVLGIRGFARKNGVRRAVLGLSGGIDSALVACLAAEALGPAAVTAIALPSRHTDPRSTETARALARALGIGFEVSPLEPLHAAAEQALAPLLAGAPPGDTTLENIQARLRAMVLMAHLNRQGGILLNTSNKTELSLGYGTLYGDMAGTLCVIGDLTKPQVYALARHIDAGRGLIPPFILERPPSAELRDDQVDPFAYPRISPAVEALIQGDPLPEDVTPEEATRFTRMIRGAEHKRWQAGIVLKVTDRAFGTGRMMPITRA
ncbi:NAD(+) synthase [Chondromyces apiculatus]|uniref:Glutamine-dependent NAD(+) synthetase n=1 Tax=Chondromyces apiculatus DSM 436 TaxID=1192034 RepID=A0A017SXV1_9BACT|nr:NAD(+) synthase [Chondromyces apiculatus]EYF01111.1 NAD synthetase [Chondromyces apiculatus DSM 436]